VPLYRILSDQDRLESIAMLAVSYADARLADIRRLRALLRLATGDATHATRQDVLVMVDHIARQIESRLRDDAMLITTALRQRGQPDWPSAPCDPLVPHAAY
jgi:hypothetical protein